MCTSTSASASTTVQDTVRVCWISGSTKWQSCHYLCGFLATKLAISFATHIQTNRLQLTLRKQTTVQKGETWPHKNNFKKILITRFQGQQTATFLHNFNSVICTADGHFWPTVQVQTHFQHIRIRSVVHKVAMEHVSPLHQCSIFTNHDSHTNTAPSLNNTNTHTVFQNTTTCDLLRSRP